MKAHIKVLMLGLGPVGSAIARELVRRDDLRLVGALDTDPGKVGRDLGEVAGFDSSLGVVVRNDPGPLLVEAAPDVAVLATTSSLETIRPQLLEIVAAGTNALTTCEELAFPWSTRPELARELDAAARAGAASILSTGVNPGFLMDYLPATISGLCRDVEAIRVDRYMDAGLRRDAFQRKVGAGLTVGRFAKAAAAGAVGHIGLRESVDMIARSQGWTLSKVAIELEPVIAGEPIEATSTRIEKGQVSGVDQVARGFVDGRERIVLRFVAAVGEPSPRDRVVIEATPRIDLAIDGGVHGDLATCNVVVNSIPKLVRAPPGLLTMLDLAAGPAVEV